jgi:hypothetical protein
MQRVISLPGKTMARSQLMRSQPNRCVIHLIEAMGRRCYAMRGSDVQPATWGAFHDASHAPMGARQLTPSAMRGAMVRETHWQTWTGIVS